MRIGTAYFRSQKDAERYYKPYGYDNVRDAVQRKLDEGEIHIGLPPVKEGETIQLIQDEGRYQITTKD